MSQQSLYRWTGMTLTKAGIHGQPLLVADSWLVENGLTGALDAHKRRFFNSCLLRGAPREEELALFWKHILPLIPRTGRWFPRIELADCDGKATLYFRMRAAPPAHEGIVLTVWPEDDPRTEFRIKGPDIGVLGEAQNKVRMLWEADEAILIDKAGGVLEGLTTGIAWWEKGCLCFPSEHLPILPSITKWQLVLIAKERGVTIKCREIHCSELTHYPVWALNSLHGIRQVSTWKPGSRNAPQQEGFYEWRKQLAMMRKEF
jgi:branched-subunit amino acid aminotransferase/4-amino-4-deoxychorismate lyase